MLTTKSSGLRYLSGFAALALALGVAACNEEGDGTDQTSAVPEQGDTMEAPLPVTPEEPMEPEPAPMEPETTQ